MSNFWLRPSEAKPRWPCPWPKGYATISPTDSYTSSDNIGLYILATLDFSVRKYRRACLSQYYCLMVLQEEPENRVLGIENSFLEGRWALMSKMLPTMNLAVDSRLCRSTQLIRRAFQSQCKRFDDEGFTPLHRAAWNGRVDVVKMLLAKGANIDLKTKKGQTALDSSRQKDHTDFLGLLARTAPKNNRPATAWNGVSRILMEVSCEERTNLSLRFATDAHVWRSVGSRLRLGQLHKSLFDEHKSHFE